MGLFDSGSLLSTDWSNPSLDYSSYTPSVDTSSLSGIGDYSSGADYSSLLNSDPLAGVGDYSSSGTGDLLSSLNLNSPSYSPSDLSGLFGSTSLSGIGDYSNMASAPYSQSDLSSLLDSLGQSGLSGIGDYSGVDNFRNLIDGTGIAGANSYLSSLDPTSSDSKSNIGGALKKLLEMLNGGIKSVNSAQRSPLGQLLKALAAVQMHRTANKNAAKMADIAQNTAQAHSQIGLGSNRTGLINMDTSVHDPMSYVQAAPLITK